MTADIIDIRTRTSTQPSSNSSFLHDEIVAGLSKPAGQRTLPTMLLYDEPGLRLYDGITVNAPEYYLFSAEEEILKTYAKEEIVPLMLRSHSGAGASIVELGAG
jgi:L-histidine Nalpha-methyltransferase / hercynylcysteine S-oxide synthase